MAAQWIGMKGTEYGGALMIRFCERSGADAARQGEAAIRARGALTGDAPVGDGYKNGIECSHGLTLVLDGRGEQRCLKHLRMGGKIRTVCG